MKPLRRSAGGFTLIELLTYVAILGVLLATALPHLDRRRETMNSVIEKFIADVRFARSKAIINGTRFCLHSTSTNRYQVRRLVLSGSSWNLDKTLRDITVPSYIGFYMQTDSGSHYQFNTRGMQAAYGNPNQTYPLYAYFWDSYGTHAVSIWPSGQAYREY